MLSFMLFLRVDSLRTITCLSTKLKALGFQHRNSAMHPGMPDWMHEGQGTARVAAAPGVELAITAPDLSKVDAYDTMSAESYEDDKVCHETAKLAVIDIVRRHLRSSTTTAPTTAIVRGDSVTVGCARTASTLSRAKAWATETRSTC
jgi:hypothetical protein